MSENVITYTELPPNYFSVVNENILLQEQNKDLQRNIELLKKALYGAKSEKLKSDEPHPNQTKLFETILEERPVLEGGIEIEVKPHTRKKRKRHEDKDGNSSHFPTELERKDIPLEPEGAGPCEACGKDKIEVSQKITEKLAIVPTQFYVERHIRPVMGCKCGECKPISTAAPTSPLPKSVLGVSFLAYILVQKFGWHLPLYRQSKMLLEHNIDIHRDVLINATLKLAEPLKLIVAQMTREIRACELVHIDETPTMVRIKEGGKKRYDKQAYFWLILGGEQVVYSYTGNRKHCNAAELLGENFKGILVSDGYDAYLNYSKANPEVSLALCWDHARRKFFEIKEHEPLAQEALEHIKVFYKVERDIKELELPPDKIPKYRKQNALKALNKFKEWCEVVRDSSLPKDKLTQACSYVINHWEGLSLYLEHGIVPISNIIIEQQVRNLKLGVRNWLFAASEVGADTVAVMNSLVCTCKMNNINMLEYFTDILSRLDTDAAVKLTPLAWKREQESKKQQ